MLTNNKLRTIIIALAATTLMACESGPSEAELEAERNRVAAAEAAEAEEARLAREAAEAKAVEVAEAKRLADLRDRAAAELDALKQKNTIYFDFDKSTIKSDFMSVLREHARYLAANPGQSIVIEGHCDSSGTPEYNIALGERRAKAIETFFTNAGVSGSQVSVVSYGEEKLAVQGTSDFAMQQNRRGVVVYQ
ncbi:OmpA family protein [Glaciecola petra]|uniref:Peptidoglycan-associated lipoprotein n=1 Tax=Glaciecola petra TaxID=3075602 RepID=A0ABU2ZPY7_9ALTE|nr:OmpA family protein [Aestuariibacter sp. P117]MDT0594672.1 OmpA family protein [Aestuariibacter sp. P117]